MARLSALLPRLAALTLVWLLATTSLTFASDANAPAIPAPAAPAPRKTTETKMLVVPDVRGQAYVFAKGILEDGGFAWRVEGAVDGYSVNVVAVQSPAPGTEVIDTGAPTIVLQLERNLSYREKGLPEREAPFAGSAVVFASGKPARKPERKERDARLTTAAVPAERKPTVRKPVRKATLERRRKPDFKVPGAPAEPQNEMPLPERARMIERRLASAPYATQELVDWWLYQHAWLVTGTRFGWSQGAESLRILVRIDQSLQRRWGFGAKSEAVARAALAFAEAQKAR